MIEEIRYWDEAGSRFISGQTQSLWRAHSDAVNTALLDAWLPGRSGGRLLKTDLFDEASGAGLFQTLAARFRSVIGIDLSPATTEAARSHVCGHAVTSCDVRFLPFADGAFSAVASISTLDHFRTRQELAGSLGELHRVLRRGGQLVLTLDNGANPVVAARNWLPFGLLHALGLVPYYVGYNCGPRRLRRMLEQTGFEVTATGAALHCPRVLAVLSCRLLQRSASQIQKDRLLNLLMWFEKLSTGPFRFVTGYFVTINATKL